MSEIVYDDGTETIPSVSGPLVSINEDDVVALVKKDGSTHIGLVKIRSNPDDIHHETLWYVGDVLLMTAHYNPFKITVHDKDIFAVLNVTILSEEWIKGS